MASLLRSRGLSKMVALSAAGGSFYFFRDDIKPYLGFKSNENSSLTDLGDKSKTPKIIENLPEKVPYLLIGGGTASHSAMKAIRGHDPKAKVLIITSESHSPYMRPALSKELWFSDKDLRKNLSFTWWNGKERSIFYEIDEFYIPIEDLNKRETGGVSLLKNLRLVKLEPDEKIAHLENGQTIKYDKCLLAPGGTPKSLPPFETASDEVKKRIIHFRSADDFLKLEHISQHRKSIAIVGGGLLGCELACALCRQHDSSEGISESTKKDIHLIFPEGGTLTKILPSYLSQWVSKKIETEGASLMPNSEVISVSMTKDGRVEMKMMDGKTLVTDYIVCAVGLEPDVELAKSSGLEIDSVTGGYLVNSELEARSNVWVAGDASCFYDTKLGRRRIEHHDHAINSGRQAGQNMIGAGKTYSHQPMFWSDLGPDLSFEAVGITDSSLQTVAVFAKEGAAILEDLKKSIVSEQEQTSQSKVKTETQATNSISDGKNDGPKSKAQTTDSPRSIAIKPIIDIDKPADPYARGVIFYVKNDIVVGILLWNMFNRLKIARRILNEGKKYDDFNELAKLFNIYVED